MKSVNDVLGLRKLDDVVQLNVRCLVVLGVSMPRFLAMLCNSVLLQALRYKIALDYHRKKDIIRATTSSVDPSTAVQSLTEVQNNATLSPSGVMNETTSSVSTTEAEQLIDFIRIELKSRERTASLRPRDKVEMAEKRKPTSVSSSFGLPNAESSQTFKWYFCKSMNQDTSSCEGYEVLQVYDERLPVLRI